MSQTISNIRPRILLTISRKSIDSIDDLRGLYTRTAVARHPCFSWAFLSLNVNSVSLSYGRRAFFDRRSTVRYSLPDELRDPACGSDSFQQFLKTILFSL